jgi:hypothetical protein
MTKRCHHCDEPMSQTYSELGWKYEYCLRCYEKMLPDQQKPRGASKRASRGTRKPKAAQAQGKP